MCIFVTRIRPVSWPGCGQEPRGSTLGALKLTYFHLKDIAWNTLKGKLKTWIISNPEVPGIDMGYVLYFQYYFHIYGAIKIGCNYIHSSVSTFCKYHLHRNMQWTCIVPVNKDIQLSLWLRYRASLIAQLVKNLPAMQETCVQSLGWEDPLEKEVAAHSSILAWRIPWTEESGRLKSMGL